MTIPFSFPQVGSGQVVQGGEAPNPLSLFLQTFLAGTGQGAQNYDRAQQRSLSSAELDLRKQEMAFRMAQEKTKQAQLEHQQEIAKQQGEATQRFLETVLPHMANTGAINAILPQPPQGGTGWTPQNNAPLPAIQQTQGGGVTPQPVQGPGATMQPTPIATTPDDRLARFLSTMAPEAAASFVQEQLPHLMAMRNADVNGGEAIQTGKGVTTFVKGKGFFDPEANGGKGGYVPYIARGKSADEERDKELDRELRRAQIDETRARTAAVQAAGLTRQFDNKVKAIRDRAMPIKQGILTLTDAQGNPLLTTSAIVNFVQAADQKAQLRSQIVQYFTDKVDQSIGGRWDIMKERLLHGTYPARVYPGLIQHLNNLLDLHKKAYDRVRNGEIKRHPELENWLTPADDYFTSETPSAPTGGLDANLTLPGRP